MNQRLGLYPGVIWTSVPAWSLPRSPTVFVVDPPDVVGGETPILITWLPGLFSADPAAFMPFPHPTSTRPEYRDTSAVLARDNGPVLHPIETPRPMDCWGEVDTTSMT